VQKNNEFIEKIKKEFRKYNDLVTLIAYGDYKLNPDLFSNLFIILYSDEDDFMDKNKNFKEIIQDYFEIKYEIFEGNKVVVFSKNNLKICFEVKKIYTIEKDKEILEKRGINWDKSVLIKRNYQKKELNQNNINKFIINFDDFFTYFYLGDFIKSYKKFNELLYILFDLKEIFDSTEQSKIWYTSKNSSNNDIDDLVKTSTELNPKKMIKKIKKLSDLFIHYLPKSLEKTKIEEILKSIEQKYPYFYNFRDISIIPNSDSEKVILNEGLVFRSASLERYDEENIEEFMKNRNISKIVDLRDEDELNLYKEKRNTFYSDKFKEKYIVNIPIHLTNVKDLFNGDDQQNHYYHFLKTMQKQIKDIFNNHFSNADKDKMIIHCEGGKDRTGTNIFGR